MPLRYSKTLRLLLTDIASLQMRGLIDEPGSQEFLHKNRRALRELQRLEAKREREIPEAEMWAEKRARQAADLAGLQSGALTPDDVNWFAGVIARNAKIKGDLF